MDLATLQNNKGFLHLPATLQLQILRLTSWNDQKKARLVCHRMCALINYCGAQIDFHGFDDNVLINKLQRCKFEFTKSIAFQNLNAKLPIISSTRLLIPKARQLQLGKTISVQNMFKLTRYYLKWSEELQLRQTDFPLVKNSSLFGASENCLMNIKKFQLTYYASRRLADNDPNTNTKRLQSLGKFLEWCSMPSLKTLNVFLSYDTMDDGFHQNLQTFLIKHGPKLKYLKLALSLRFWNTFINTFEYMLNVEKIEVSTSDAFELIDYDVISRGFSHFNELRSIKMGPRTDNDFKLVGLLLSNNINMQSLDINNLRSLSWLYNIDGALNNLTYLHLKVKCVEESTIFNTAENNLELASLRRMTIQIDHEQTDLSKEAFDWRESFINWLILFSPNLRALNLLYYDIKVEIDLYDFENLIDGLPRLSKIELHTLFHEFVTVDLKDYLERNPNIYLKKDELWFDCVIEVERPVVTLDPTGDQKLI